MNLTNRQQILGIIAILTVGLLVGDKLIFTPLIKSWKTRTTRIAELKRVVAQGMALLERENSIRSRWETMRTNALPSNFSEAENQLLKAFDRWARASNVGISAIHPQPQGRRSSSDIVALECRADAFGNLAALSRFLYEVEKDPLAVKINLLELTSSDNDGRKLTLGLQVSGLILGQPGS